MGRRKIKVWVVMGNDYVDSVWDTEEAANIYIDSKGETKPLYSRVYWRAYPFEVQRGLQK